MTKVHPVHWLYAQASAGIKELPRNGAWVVSRIVGSPGAGVASASGAATDAARRVSAAMADALPGGHDSVEIRLNRAEAAVMKAKKAEQEALAEAQSADRRAEAAKTVAEQGRERMREATREGKQEIERRTKEARQQLDRQLEQERERASQDVADRLEKLTAEVQAHIDESRQDAEDAARRAQERIDQAHEQMAAARVLAADATKAAQDAAEQAHQQVKAVAEEAEQHAGTADRVLNNARGTEEWLASETARAVQAEREYDVPERLDEHTKAELIDIAHALQIPGAARMQKTPLVRAIQKASRAKSRA